MATVTADLLTAEERVGKLDDIINRWREEVGEVPDVLALNFKEPVIGPGGVPLEIRLYGAELDQLKQASLELQGWLARYRGVFDLSDDLRPGKPELRLRLREGALALGLDASTVAGQLRAAFYGSTASEIQVDSRGLRDRCASGSGGPGAASGIWKPFRILTPGGDQVPLSAVATIQQDRGYSRIQRVNGIRTVTVSGDLDTRLNNAREIVNHTQREFLPKLFEKYPGPSRRVSRVSRRIPPRPAPPCCAVSRSAWWGSSCCSVFSSEAMRSPRW